MKSFDRLGAGLVKWGAVIVVALGASQYSLKLGKEAYLSPVDVALGLVLLVWGIRVWWEKRLRSVRFPPLVSVLFVAAGALSFFRSSDRLGSLKEILQWGEYFIVAFVLLADALREFRHVRTITWTFLGVAGAIVLIAAAQYLCPGVDAFDVRGTFGNRNILGGFLALALPVAFGVSLCERRWPIRGGLLLAVAAGCLVSLSGATLLALLVALSVVALGRSKGVFPGLVAVALAAVALALPHLPRDNLREWTRSVALFDENGDVTPRVSEWQAALNMWEDNPVLGVGAGNYQSNIGRYYGYVPRANRNLTERDSHNTYLVLLSSTGLAGLTAFLGMLIFFAHRAGAAFHSRSDPWEKGLALGLLGGLIGFSINGLWAGLLVRGIGVPLALVFALIAALDAAVAAENPS
jgi:O-antigen ligase